MKVFRPVEEVTLRDHVRSDAITKDLQIQDVVRFGKVIRRCRRDYVDRMDDQICTKIDKNNDMNDKMMGYCMPLFKFAPDMHKE